MRTPSLMGLVVSTAWVIWAAGATQTLGAPDPAAEQLSYTSVFECDGCVGGGAPTLTGRISILVDVDDTTRVIVLPASDERIAWSPDGHNLLSVRGGEIYLSNITGLPGINLTNFPGAYDRTPAWSPDGARIAFASTRDGTMDLYLMNTNGSGVVRLRTGAQTAWRPAWSRDSTHLAFNCTFEPQPTTSVDVCTIAVNGSGFTRLTSEESFDQDPDWSPDGRTILFSTARYGGQELAVMNPDGTDVRRVTHGGVLAYSPAWSSDGTRIAFVDSAEAENYGWSNVSVMDADATNVTSIGLGHDPAWRPRDGGLNERPVASFTFECIEQTCTFDASSSSDSDGSITSYGWQFSDGTTAAGVTASHQFAAGHTYNVQLVVMDDKGALEITQQVVDFNQRPIVSFITTCAGLTCTFDGSASFDPDGTLAMFMWRFGDGDDRVSTRR